MSSPSIVRRSLLVLAALCTACTLTAAVAAWARPRTFATRAEAIGYVLQQRGVSYEHIYITQNWPESVNTLTYAATLDVGVRGMGDVGGMIECRKGKQSCLIALPRLGIFNLAVPDTTTVKRPALLVWIDQRMAELRSILKR
jgi:hypothetical protein